MRAGATQLVGLGNVTLRQRQFGEAAKFFSEALALGREIDDKLVIAQCLEGLAVVASAGSPLVSSLSNTTKHAAVRAAQLFGAAAALHDALQAPVSLTERADFDGSVAAIRTQLDDGTWSAAYTEGRTMSLHQAITYALETIALRRHDGAAA